VSELASFLPIAVRAWTTYERHTKPRRRRTAPPIRHALVLDTETNTDSAQGLLYGAFRYCRLDGTTVTPVAEGLLYADDLAERDPVGLQRLRDYAASRKADVNLSYLAVEPNWEQTLLSRREFVDRWLYHVGYPHHNRRDPALIVMFNAPFDLSRLAVAAAEARADMYGGFSFTVWTDQHGAERAWRPRLAVKAIDSKRSLKKFRRLERGAGDFAGHLLDLRTLVFALTGEGHTLDSAARSYQLPGKATVTELGGITTETIDYCRRDVAVTTELLQAALADFAAHPIDLQATKAYSPASIAKAYLRATGIQPRLARQPDVDPHRLGQAMAGFYGGRAEVHIRHQPLPVRLVDFTSMYPTVDQLLGLWQLVTADRVETVDVTDEINELLANIRLEDCFDPDRWRNWVVIAELMPAGDVLPVRASYQPTALQHDERGRPQVTDWSIGVNPLHADTPMTYALPDLIASTLHTGRAPQLRGAVRFVPVGGAQPTLTPIALRGRVPVDPEREDFFQRVVEARQQIKRTTKGHAGCLCGDCRLEWFLKILANAGSYGIFAEMIRHELARGSRDTVEVFTGAGSFATSVSAPEEPGEFCFPPIAACITSAARLMLTLLERGITDAGGTWMFCDTDSMAIVATPTGGLLACPGGSHRLPNGIDAALALSHQQVDAIRDRFRRLNPYDQTVVPDLLKTEIDGTCLAISAKRYAIWDTADPAQLPGKVSQHGLGRYLDPVTPREDRRDGKGQLVWVLAAWRWIAAAMRDPHTPLPDWAHLPAVSRISVSSITLWRPFRSWNQGKPWAEQVKPFNFLLVADVDPFGFPPAADPARFRLIAPYTDKPDEWDGLEWRNLYDSDGPTYRITTDRHAPAEPDLAIVKSYGQVLREYRLHPEHKFSGPDGEACGRLTRGVLRRRPVRVLDVRYIGKEANRLDDVQAGLVGQLGEVLNEYDDPNDSWVHRLVLPVLAGYSGRQLATLLGTDRRTIDRIRAGQMPRPGLRDALLHLAVQQATDDVCANGTLPRDEARRMTPATILTCWGTPNGTERSISDNDRRA
jgi:hypothetical protein